MTRHTNKAKEAAARIFERNPELAPSLLTSVLHSYIMEGRIDPKGKTLAQISAEFQRLGKKVRNYAVYCGYQEKLDREAERAFQLENYGLAVTLWATLLEHEINHLLSFVPGLRNYDRKYTTIVMRDSSLRSKLVIIHALLGLDAPSSEILGALENFSNTRNQFIHYKWPGVIDPSAEERETKEFKNACLKYPLIRQHLVDIEVKGFLRGFNGQFVRLKSGEIVLRRTPRLKPY